MDSKAHIEIKFSIHGEDFETKMSINWSDDYEGVDQRVISWFGENFYTAESNYLAEIEAEERRQKKAVELRREKEEFLRLRDKFDPDWREKEYRIMHGLSLEGTKAAAQDNVAPFQAVVK